MDGNKSVTLSHLNFSEAEACRFHKTRLSGHRGPWVWGFQGRGQPAEAQTAWELLQGCRSLQAGAQRSGFILCTAGKNVLFWEACCIRANVIQWFLVCFLWMCCSSASAVLLTENLTYIWLYCRDTCTVNWCEKPITVRQFRYFRGSIHRCCPITSWTFMVFMSMRPWGILQRSYRTKEQVMNKQYNVLYTYPLITEVG